MKKNKRILFLLSLFMIVLSMATAGTFAWYVAENEEKGIGTMGNIDSKIKNSNTMAAYGMTASLTKSFELENKSSIDSYVRIAYTLAYKGKDNNASLVDTSKLNVSNMSVMINGRSVTTQLMETTSASGYKKKFIVPLLQDQGRSYYYKVAPGENISGSISINNSVPSEDTPELILTMETIQATQKAVTDAQGNGWDANYVKPQ